MKQIKIFITGGHLTPTLAVIEKIIKEKYPWRIVFIGRKFATEEDKLISEEYRVIVNKRIKFLPITTGRLRRFASWPTIISLFKIPVGFAQAINYLLREKPKLILSFGGYIALPIAIAGWMFRVPIVTHEQSRKLGLANKIIAVIADKVCMSWSDTTGINPGEKIVLTGIPIRQQIFKPPSKPSGIFNLINKHLPLIYIMGGITGSRKINSLLFLHI